jgi:hypothetical protein
MRRRQLACLGLLVIFFGVVICCLPSQRPSGPVFRGKTAAQWERELQHWEFFDSGPVETIHFATRCSTRFTEWYRISPWWESWLQTAGIEVSHDDPEVAPLVDGAPDALPVLMELLQSADPKVRRVAATGLEALRGAAREAVPDLIRTLDDPEWQVRYAVMLVRRSCLQTQ